MWLLLIGLLFFSADLPLITSSKSSPHSPSICCEYLKQPSQLVSCLRNHSLIYSPPNFPSKPSSSSSPSILFIIFASQNIYHYVAFTLLINSQFISSHPNYDLIFLTDQPQGDNNKNQSHYDYFPQDRRWNKIGGVIDALDPQTGWGRHADYLVAIDADLIILDDQSLNFPLLFSTYPKSNLLLSADTSDIANTGFMIIKNTKWSYSFFQTWYASRHSFDCDQHAFNDLYSQLMNANKNSNSKKKNSRIQILEENEVNSKFPVSANFQEIDRVLHLMGERDIVRTAIFEYAAESYCWEYIEQNDPFLGNEEDDDEEERQEREMERKKRSLRFGITHDTLTSIIQEQLVIPVKEQHALCSDLLYEAPPHETLQRTGTDQQINYLVSEINHCFTQLHSFTSDLCASGKDIVKGTRECTDLFEKNYLLAKKGTVMVPFAQLVLLDHMTRNLYSSFLLMESTPEAIETGEKVLLILSQMSGLIPPSDIDLQRFMFYRRSIALSQISYAAKELNLADKSLALAQESLALALKLHDTNPPKSHVDYETYTRTVILAYQLVGDRLAPLPQKRHEGKEMYLKSLELAEQLYSSARRESSQIGVLVKDSLMSLLSVSAVDHDQSEVSKWISQIKQNALELLSEEDYRLVLYYESMFTSMAATSPGATSQKKRPHHKQQQQQSPEL